jgi:hypothetical protein
LGRHPEEYAPRCNVIMLIVVMVALSLVQDCLPPLEVVTFFESKIDASAVSYPAQRQVTFVAFELFDFQAGFTVKNLLKHPL